MKKIIVISLLILLTSPSYSQNNITNTLGTDGVFAIKDATNFYFTLAQSTGLVNILHSLRLENTTSLNVGVISKGDDRFLHNYGSANTFLGVLSGNFSMTGIYNTGVGYWSLCANTSGGYNSAFGYGSLQTNTEGANNSAFGTLSLQANTTGSNNTAVGYKSSFSNIEGSFNTSMGHESLFKNTTGGENTAIGHAALYCNENGCNNTAVGYYSLLSNKSGSGNTAVGYYSLYVNTAGIMNTSLGEYSLRYTINSNNTGIGYSSLYNNTTGRYNTSVGNEAGSSLVSGNNVTCIGNNSQPSSNSISDEITLGNSSIGSLRCAVTTITSLSDARDKKNIENLNLGINFLMKLKPRVFNWDKREWYDGNVSDGSKMQETPTAGFIAQELDEVQTSENAEWLNLVLKNNPDKLEATPGNLLPVMVKAIQDLKTENDELKNELNGFKTRLTALENGTVTQNPQSAGFLSGNINLNYLFLLVFSTAGFTFLLIKKHTKK